MGRYNNHSRYSVTALSGTDLATDPAYLRYLVDSGRDTTLICSDENIGEMIRYALNESTSVNNATIGYLLEADEPKGIAANFVIISEFLASGNPVQVGKKATALADVIARYIAATEPGKKTRKELIATLPTLVSACIDPSDVEEVFESFSSVVNYSATHAERMTLFNAIDSYVTTHASAKHVADVFADVRANGLTWRNNENWISSAVLELASESGDVELVKSILASPLSEIVDGYALVGEIPLGKDAKFAIEIGKRDNFPPSLVESVFYRYDNEDPEGQMAFARALIENADGDEQQRAGIAHLVGLDSADISKYRPIIFEKATVDPENADDRYGVGDRSSLIDAIIRRKDVPLLLQLLSFDGLDKDCRVSITRAVPRIVRLDPENADVANSFWDLFDLPEDSKVTTSHTPAEQAKIELARTGLISADRLAVYAGSIRPLGNLVRSLLSPAQAEAETPEPKASSRRPVRKPVDPNAWDNAIDAGTSFESYIEIAGKAGFTPLAAMGLYVTDTRIDLDVRGQAREDFMALLARMPNRVAEVPDKVWANLNRVQCALPISPDLASVLLGLGGSAEKLGSKHLVKSVLL